MRHKRVKKPVSDTSSSPKGAHKLVAFIIVLIGFLAIFYLVSTIGEFIQNIKEREKIIRNIRVEVLNGTSRNELAKNTGDFLRSKGFDVVDIGNAKSNYKHTVILDRADIKKGNAKLVRSVIRQGKLDYLQDSLLLLHVTLILGEDYKERRKR